MNWGQGEERGSPKETSSGNGVQVDGHEDSLANLIGNRKPNRSLSEAIMTRLGPIVVLPRCGAFG